MILLTIQFTVLQSSILETWPALYSGSINLLENNTLLDMHEFKAIAILSIAYECFVI